MNRLVFLAVCVLATASCGRKDETTFQRQPGLLDESGNTRIVAPVAPPARPPAPAPELYADEYRPAPTPPVVPTPVEVPDASAQDTAVARDLGAELSSLLPAVTRCVELALAATQRDGLLVISVSAVVLGTGRISRATVTAPSQPASAIACMQQSVLGLRLPEGVPNAPLTVQGTTELTVKPARAHVADAAVPSPIPIAPTLPVGPSNPNLAQPQADDMARPEIDSLAGPP